MSRPPRRSALSAFVILLLSLFLATACGPILANDDSSSEGREATSVPDISDVDTIDDPRSYQGPIQIELDHPQIEPVNENPEPELPVTVTDNQGTEVTVEDVSRILPLDIYGTISNTVFQLGLGDNVVGRDISSQFPEIEDRPLVTSNGHELSAEAIMDLDPTVILTDTSLGPWDVILQARDAGIPVVVVDGERTLDNLSALTSEIADALGVPQEGKQLGKRIEKEADAKLAEIKDQTPSELSSRPRTIFLYARGQSGIYYMFGQDSGADTLIEAIGGYDVTEELGWNGMKPVNDEALVSAQPDVLVMMNKGLDSVGGVDGLLEHFPALANTPAGENERIIAMNDDQVLSFGPRTADVLNALAVALYAPESL